TGCDTSHLLAIQLPSDVLGSPLQRVGMIVVRQRSRIRVLSLCRCTCPQSGDDIRLPGLSIVLPKDFDVDFFPRGAFRFRATLVGKESGEDPASPRHAHAHLHPPKLNLLSGVE